MEIKTDNADFWKSVAPLLKDHSLLLHDQRVLYAGPVFTELLGIAGDELVAQSCDEYLSVIDRGSLSDALRELHSQPGQKLTLSLTLTNAKTSQAALLEVEFQPLRLDAMTLICGVICKPKDYLENPAQQEDPRLQVSSILSNFSNTIFRTNKEGEIILISDNVKELMGYEKEEVLGTPLSTYYWTPEDRERSIQEIIKNDGNVTQVDVVMRHKDGSPVWLSSNVHFIKDAQGEAIGVEGIGHDITYQKKLEQKLETLALTDSLTQLPNRRALMDELHHLFVTARINNNALALIMLDVKGTRIINESYGYIYGDSLLRQVAALLKVHVIFPQVLGRVSGDEFLFILPSYTIKNAVQFIAPVIEAIKQNPLAVGDRKIPYALSIGITELKKNDKNEYSLLDRADKATLVSKQGMSQYEVM